MSKKSEPARWLLNIGVVAGILCVVGLGHSKTCAQTENRVVAVVNGVQITQKDVDAFAVTQIFPLEQQLHAIRKTALENLIIRVLLQAEATKRGISIDELKKQMTSARDEVPAGEVEDFYSQYAATFAAMSPEEAKERLRLDLETRSRMKKYKEAIAKFRDGSRIEILLQEPRLQFPANIKSPSLGPEKAPITIIEVSDFQCPFCRNSQSVIKQVLQNYKDKVRLVFVHLPLEIHSQAFLSARASYCAGEQGLFWQYHDRLFASDDLSPFVLHKLASELRLDAAKFDLCLKSEASGAAVLSDVRDAKRFTIESTPTFIINGRLLRGVHTFEEFKEVIENELSPAHRVVPAPQPVHFSP